MDRRTTAAVLAVAGVVIAVTAALSLSPTTDRTMVVRVIDEDPDPTDVEVLAYEDLPPTARDAVDGAVREGWARLSTVRDHEAVRALRGHRYVRVNGTVYWLETTQADDGGLLEGMLRNVGLATGGVLIGAAAHVLNRRRPVAVLAAVPAATVATIVGSNALTAPTLAAIPWFADASFGLAASVPVLGGIAVGRRDGRIAGIAVGALVLSVGTLLAGAALAALVPLVVFALPGAGFGWWLGAFDRSSAGTER